MCISECFLMYKDSPTHLCHVTQREYWTAYSQCQSKSWKHAVIHGFVCCYLICHSSGCASHSLCLSCFSASLCFLLVLCLPTLESRWISELMFHLPWLNVSSTLLFKQISTLSSPCQANHDYLIWRGFNNHVISAIVSLLPLCLFLAWAWHSFLLLLPIHECVCNSPTTWSAVLALHSLHQQIV